MAFLYGRIWTRDELLRHVGHMDQLAGIKLMEGADGVERGGRILEVWTGSGLAFQVLAERALDVSACSYQGQSLVWRSAAGDATPIYYSADGLDWLRTFPGGLLATCGLDYFGPPTEDAGEKFGIHGRIGALPASQVNYRTWWDGDEYELSISAEVRQFRLFGEHLVLRREIRTRLGSRTIAIHDSVTNAGYTPQPHMILYHFNFGFPLLSADSQVELATSETYPRDSRAVPGIHDWRTFHVPTAGWQEQVFRHKPIPNEQGWSKVVLRNPPLGLAVALRFESSTLPYLFQWKQTGEGAYVLGLEPGNCSGIEGRTLARERGDLPMLDAGETRHYHLELEVNPAS